mgnify:CR=1 FL=1
MFKSRWKERYIILGLCAIPQAILSLLSRPPDNCFLEEINSFKNVQDMKYGADILVVTPSIILFLLWGSTATVGSSKNIILGLCVKYGADILVVTYKKGKNNLLELIDYLKDAKLQYDKIFSERPIRIIQIYYISRNLFL